MATVIKFEAIDLISKKIAPRGAQPISPTDYGFNFKVAINASAERKTAVVVTEISIELSTDNSELAKFHTAMYFEFKDFETIFKKIDEERFDIPIELEILMKSVALSTTRGIIYSEVRGTYLDAAVLPLVDIPGIVRRDREAKENENKKAD